ISKEANTVSLDTSALSFSQEVVKIANVAITNVIDFFMVTVLKLRFLVPPYIFSQGLYCRGIRVGLSLRFRKNKTLWILSTGRAGNRINKLPRNISRICRINRTALRIAGAIFFKEAL